jgi:pimeloyl-ACP methyl ester carboxylesterase
MRGTYSALVHPSLTARSSADQDGPVPTSVTKANGIDIGYETLGDADDEPLLLVMGLGAQLIAWPIELCDALVDRGFFVIRYDNRDTGLSTWFPEPGRDIGAVFMQALQGQPIESAYDLSDLAADGMALLDQLGLESAHVVGASLGGMIAQTMAIEHPTRVRTLTSIMSTTGEPEYGQPTPEAVAAVLQPVGPTRAEVIEAGVRRAEVLTGPEHFDEDRARAIAAEAYDRAFNPEGVARHLLAMVASGSRAEPLARLDVPTMVIHGDLDPLVTPSGGERTAELVPGAQLLMIEGMGHDLPPAVLGQVVEAITSLAARIHV